VLRAFERARRLLHHRSKRITLIPPDDSDSSSSSTATLVQPDPLLLLDSPMSAPPPLPTPAPTSITISPFYGKPDESVAEFLEQVDLIADKEKEAFQDQDQHTRAKLVLLKTNLRDKAKKFLRTLDSSTLESYLRITHALKNQYPEPKSDQGELLDKILELSQGKSESTKKYIKRAKKISEDVGGNKDLGGSLARKFVKGLRDRNLRLLVKASDNRDADGNYNFQKTLAKVVDLIEQDRQSDSDSSTSSDSEDEVLLRHRKNRDHRDRKWRGSAKTEETKKVTVVEPLASGLTSRQEEEIKKRVEELLRERAGVGQMNNSFGFGGIHHIPQQIPVNAVYSSGPYSAQPSQVSAVYAHGPYGQQQGFQQPGFNQGMQYQPNQFQQPGFQGGPYPQNQGNRPAGPSGPSGQFPRTVTCYNCGKRGTHYEDQCPDPKASEEFRASIVARVARARSEYQAKQVAMQQPSAPQQSSAGGNQQQDVNAMFVDEPAMLNSALQGMTFADCYQLDGVQAVEKRKRAIASEGEVLGPKRQDVGEGRAFSDADLRAGVPSATKPTNLPQMKKKRPAREHVPIRMMKGQAAYDAVAALRDTEVRGLSWGNFFELAPKVKSQLAHGLVQERPARKRKAKIIPSGVNAVAEGRGQAFPEPTGAIANFYTVAHVAQTPSIGNIQWFQILLTLIDGGSVLNMITLALALRMQLTLVPQDEVSMRTAASTVHPIEFYALIDIEIAGVVASIKCYVLPASIRPSYSILLGRRWMKQVRALGDYANDRYCIHDMAGKQYVLTPHPTPDDIREEIPTLCVNHAATTKSLDEETVSELSVYSGSDSESEYDAALQTIQRQAWVDMDYDASSEEEDYEDASDGLDESVDRNSELGNDRRH
jgi:hypothetical protein